MKLILDFETDSDVDLRRAGAHKYARDPSTQALCCSLTWEDGRQELWLPGDPVPCGPDDGPPIFEAHGAAFERAIIRHIMIPQHGWPGAMLELPRWRDTMAACAYRALPLGLDDAAKVLHLPVQKGKMPRPGKEGWTWEKLADLYDYCLQDGRAELALSQRIGELPPDEQRLWELDQTINERGVFIDMELCEAAIAVERQVRVRLNAELRELTNGAVETSDQRDRLLAWLQEQDLCLPDLTADTISQWLGAQGTLLPLTRRALTIRQLLAKSSAKKYRAALDCRCDDGRARGLLQYHGASTGRWAGRLVQPQNFARPTMEAPIEDLVDAIKTRDPEWIAVLYGDVFTVLKNAVRGVIVAAPGYRLVVGDFGAIEGVVNACISGEEWKVRAYAEGADMYCLFASQALGFTVEKAIAKDPAHPDHKQHKDARQDVGKPGELAFGYEGGVGAWRKFDASDKWSDEQVDGFKVAWRGQHPAFVRLWRRLNEAVLRAVLDPTQTYAYNGCTFAMQNGCLTLRLPSGRLLWYNEPRVVERRMPWTDRDGKPVFRPAVCIKAWKEGRWRDLDLYGGHLTENVISGTSRDLLVGAMYRCEATEWPIILTVHDEIICEVPEFAPVVADDMRDVMGAGEPWAAGWPIRVDAWTGRRYKKP